MKELKGRGVRGPLYGPQMICDFPSEKAKKERIKWESEKSKWLQGDGKSYILQNWVSLQESGSKGVDNCPKNQTLSEPKAN